MSPSDRPTRNTASHSRPLAECSEARVMPCTVGACWCWARSSSSATSSVSVNSAPRVVASWSARLTRACRDSHRSRAAPVADGGSAE